MGPDQHLLVVELKAKVTVPIAYFLNKGRSVPLRGKDLSFDRNMVCFSTEQGPATGEPQTARDLLRDMSPYPGCPDLWIWLRRTQVMCRLVTRLHFETRMADVEVCHSDGSVAT